jgi:CBS domain-containing protein
MATVKDLINAKGNQVWSISPDASVIEALVLMAEKNVGALIVLQNEQVVGIISERDFARGIARIGRCVVESSAKDFMTKEVFTVSPDMTTDECMNLMTDKKIRHLPVVVENNLIGLISIGDVVKEVISTKESTIHTLENYIGGTDYNR